MLAVEAWRFGRSERGLVARVEVPVRRGRGRGVGWKPMRRAGGTDENRQTGRRVRFAASAAPGGGDRVGPSGPIGSPRPGCGRGGGGAGGVGNGLARAPLERRLTTDDYRRLNTPSQPATGPRTEAAGVGTE